MVLKCALEIQSSIFGDKMHEQIEERLKFYESGEAPRKNVDVMKEAISEVAASQVTSEKKKKKKRKKEKNGLNETGEEQKSETPAEITLSASGKKKKKKISGSFQDLSETPQGKECFFYLLETPLITAICIQAQTANVLTRCLRFRT